MTPTTYVAFVRAVMIGRDGLHRDVLLDMFDRHGGADATSYISTGNVSFVADVERTEVIVDQVEHELAALLDRPTELFVRSLDELVAMRDAQPFADPPFVDPLACLVTMFRSDVPPGLVLPIDSARGDHSVFATGPREVFSVTRKIDGRAQDPGGVIERLGGERVTTRAWGTITRIVDRLRPSAKNDDRTSSPGSASGADPRA